MIKLQIELNDARPHTGTRIAYQAFPEEDATDEEISTSNFILACCSLLSHPEFIALVAPFIESELEVMRQEQKAALDGSQRIM